ncbi:hypothetical protein [Marinomonas posidonica]|uniref:hypothetical protein n=1 Tax=Marinomonas posidonica TaxID=936476 RepID=UPI0037363150
MTEYYWAILKRERYELEAVSGCENERREYAKHFLDKADAFYQILYGLVKLKRKDLSDWLLNKYDMQGVFASYEDWIQDMNSNYSEHGWLFERFER